MIIFNPIASTIILEIKGQKWLKKYSMEKFTKSKCPLLLSETTNMKGKVDEALEPSTSKSANESRSNLIELPRKAKFDKSWLERFMVGPWKEDKIVGDVQVKDEAMKIHERAIFKLLKEKRADRACQVGMPASHIADDSVLLWVQNRPIFLKCFVKLRHLNRYR